MDSPGPKFIIRSACFLWITDMLINHSAIKSDNFHMTIWIDSLYPPIDFLLIHTFCNKLRSSLLIRAKEFIRISHIEIIMEISCYGCSKSIDNYKHTDLVYSVSSLI